MDVFYFNREFNLQKVLSNSEDIKIKNWLIEEAHNEEEEKDLNEQVMFQNFFFAAIIYYYSFIIKL